MITYYLTLSKYFPATHKRAGQFTGFRGKLFDGLDPECDDGKIHTIRVNYEFWHKRFEKIANGEACLSIRQWLGKPYAKGSSQVELVRLTREDGIGLQKLQIVKKKNTRVPMCGLFTLIVDKRMLQNWQETTVCTLMTGQNGLRITILANQWELYILLNSDISYGIFNKVK